MGRYAKLTNQTSIRLGALDQWSESGFSLEQLKDIYLSTGHMLLDAVGCSEVPCYTGFRFERCFKLNYMKLNYLWKIPLLTLLPLPPSFATSIFCLNYWNVEGNMNDFSSDHLVLKAVGVIKERGTSLTLLWPLKISSDKRCNTCEPWKH